MTAHPMCCFVVEVRGQSSLYHSSPPQENNLSAAQLSFWSFFKASFVLSKLSCHIWCMCTLQTWVRLVWELCQTGLFFPWIIIIFAFFQCSPTRRSKSSQPFEGAASLPSLETPTPTSALLPRWCSLPWLSATPNQVGASALPSCCSGCASSLWARARSVLRSQTLHLVLGDLQEERVSLTSEA